jgi:hypothetical protein
MEDSMPSPWVDGLGCVLKIGDLQQSETIVLDLDNSSNNGVPDSVVFGPYRPTGAPGWISGTGGGPVGFQVWGSSTGDATVYDVSVPIFSLIIGPQQLTIKFASAFTQKKSTTYFVTFYAWFKKDVTDMTLKRSGGKLSSSLSATWVDANGDYDATAADISGATSSIEYPVSSYFTTGSPSSSSSSL